MNTKRKMPDWLAIVILSAVLGFLGYYLGVVRPAGEKMKTALVQLKSEQVTRVRFYTEKSSDGKLAARERILTPAETETFLSLVSRANHHSPNHPHGVWGCNVEIFTTTEIPVFRFSIISTANDGLQLRFSSGRRGWNYGILRNDELKPFVEEVFKRKSP